MAIAGNGILMDVTNDASVEIATPLLVLVPMPVAKMKWFCAQSHYQQSGLHYIEGDSVVSLTFKQCEQDLCVNLACTKCCIENHARVL